MAPDVRNNNNPTGKASDDKKDNIQTGAEPDNTKKKISIVIDTINILVSTNIPDLKDISLTSKILVGTSPNAAKYNEYPYITNSVQLKGGFLKNKSYNEILDFFFIKEVFLSISVII